MPMTTTTSWVLTPRSGIIHHIVLDVSKGQVPSLSFEVMDSYVWTSNNETGFREMNVRAVCDIDASTKLSANAIGRKGLGFKSVFKGTLFPLQSVNLIFLCEF